MIFAKKILCGTLSGTLFPGYSVSTSDVFHRHTQIYRIFHVLIRLIFIASYFKAAACCCYLPLITRQMFSIPENSHKRKIGPLVCKKNRGGARAYEFLINPVLHISRSVSHIPRSACNLPCVYSICTLLFQAFLYSSMRTVRFVSIAENG